MKSETPIESLRSARPKPETRSSLALEAGDSADDFEPRYVEVPRRRRAYLAAERNLKWGLAIFLLALGLVGAALVISGPRALLPMVICLVTFTVLWVMARVRVFQQRNGVFFAAALICLLGSIIPMIEQGYAALDRMVHPRASSTVATPTATDLPAATGPDSAPGIAANQSTEAEPPSLIEALQVKPPTDATTSLVRVVADTKVTIGRKPYLLRAGDTFALDDVTGGQVSFFANELRLSLPETAVELLAPKLPQPVVVNAAPAAGKAAKVPQVSGQPSVSDQEPPADVTARAEGEAMRRYPAIGVKDSAENELYVRRVGELRVERPEFFEELDWPLHLAEALAQEQGWQRAK